MTDLVVGLGEIGRPIYQLLESRGFDVDGWDIQNPSTLKDNYDMIHICIPYSEDFHNIVSVYKPLGPVVVHSTVAPGTCKKLDCIYSPVRGVHARMLEDLKHYAKYYSGNYNAAMMVRFQKTVNVPDSTKLETTKIICDTTYYGFLIAFRKYIDRNYEVDWSFTEEIHEKLGNRPLMYNDNKPIGGHCVVPNLDLIDDEFLREFIK